jgi:toxin secretion/phage lysis holin
MRRKVLMFSAVFFCYVIDVGMGLHGALRNTAICGYSANEALSVLENVGRMGLGSHIPDFLRKKILQLRDEKAGKR